MAYWWVNQGHSFRQELEAGILWAPTRTQAGRRQSHWETMTEVRPGDTVIHYASQVRALSLVTTAAIPARRPREIPGLWSGDGRLVRTVYREALQVVRLSNIPEVWRTGHSSDGPFKYDGGVKQGYLFRVDDGFFKRFIERYGDLFSDAPVVLPAEAKDGAAELLRRLLGRDILTVHGRRNRIIDVQSLHVVVVTERSPNGQRVPIAEVEAALVTLRTTGRVEIHPAEVGHRSSFIGAVLLTLPGVELVDGTPPVIAVRSLTTSDAPAERQEPITFEGDLSRPVTAAQRREQSTLRQLLFGSATVATCALCGDAYPVRFLVAAHIKMRSLCTDEERRDLVNIAMPACQFGCDALYEAGYISVGPDGRIVSSAIEENGTLAERLADLAGRPCLSFSENSRRYFEWHFSTRFRG